jgi:hypothetical protein
MDRRVGWYREHGKIELFDLAMTEKVEAFSDGSVGVWGLSE